jgi:hypothetical protein
VTVSDDEIPESSGGDLSGLTDSLLQVMALGGVRAAALIDIAAGMVVRSEGEEDKDFPAAAACMADAAMMARGALGLAVRAASWPRRSVRRTCSRAWAARLGTLGRSPGALTGSRLRRKENSSIGPGQLPHETGRMP